MTQASPDPIHSLERERRWARARQSGAHGLRRGAWYLVVNVSSTMVVLNVRHDNVPVPRTMVELAERKPEAWSVVRWDQRQLGARRASESRFGLSYAVCANCSSRQVIDPPQTDRMRCDECGVDWVLDWENPC